MSTGHVVSRTVRDNAAFLDATHGPAARRSLSRAVLRAAPFSRNPPKPPRRLRIAVDTHAVTGMPTDPACIEAVARGRAAVRIARPHRRSSVAPVRPALFRAATGVVVLRKRRQRRRQAACRTRPDVDRSRRRTEHACDRRIRPQSHRAAICGGDARHPPHRPRRCALPRNLRCDADADALRPRCRSAGSTPSSWMARRSQTASAASGDLRICRTRPANRPFRCRCT